MHDLVPRREANQGVVWPEIGVVHVVFGGRLADLAEPCAKAVLKSFDACAFHAPDIRLEKGVNERREHYHQQPEHAANREEEKEHCKYERAKEIDAQEQHVRRLVRHRISSKLRR